MSPARTPMWRLLSTLRSASISVIEDQLPERSVRLWKRAVVIFTDTGDGRQSREDESLHLLKSTPHRALLSTAACFGYNLISDEMKNPSLKKLVEIIGYKEGLPVVINPGILDPKEFIDTVLNVRIPESVYAGHTRSVLQPILPRSWPSVSARPSKPMRQRPSLNVADLKLIPLVFAGWLRYLMGVDDNGNAFTPSPDPMLAEASSLCCRCKTRRGVRRKENACTDPLQRKDLGC